MGNFGFSILDFGLTAYKSEFSLAAIKTVSDFSLKPFPKIALILFFKFYLEGHNFPFRVFGWFVNDKCINLLLPV